MFERRLKIFLAVLFVASLGLALRAAQLQVVEHRQWRERAAEAMKRSLNVETVRGSILDFKGRPIAVDEPCVDACVDYRALLNPPDEGWVRNLARKCLRERLGPAYTEAPRARQVEMRDAEMKQIKADLDAMWGRLAKVAGVPPEQIEEARQAIVTKVEMRRRSVWYRNYQRAMKEHEQQVKDPPPAWRRWLAGEDQQDAPKLDDFAVDVEEQFRDHVILRAVNNGVRNELGKYIDRYPGLSLKPSTHRFYPWGDAACHVIGHLSRVTREDLDRDPNLGRDELRQYFPNDLIGRNGVEALCEQTLRGTRGKRERIAVSMIAAGGAKDASDEAGEVTPDGWKELPGQPPQPGNDVRLTIDIELQSRIQSVFAAVKVVNQQDKSEDYVPLHGAAVVIDVPTGEVRAITSYPTFDLNTFDEEYERLAGDELERPLFNRATMSQLVPGSTAKPIVGLGAITDGLLLPHTGIECTGFLVLDGRTYRSAFRCWTQSIFGAEGIDTHHHRIPSAAPHVGEHGNPDGFLTFADALQRSCNIYFETLGDRMKIEGLSKWYGRFGLGRPTGIGIPEARGVLPSDFKGDASERRSTAWLAAIGQGHIGTTPVQMANVAATIARGGVWVRPRLVAEGLAPDWRPPDGGPDRVDLGIAPAALAAAREGMVRVVNTRAGTGLSAHREDMVVAGKTGTATATPMRVKVLDERGRPVLDEKGKPKYELLQLSTQQNPNPRAPWYRGTGRTGVELDHAWFVGFAPADNPKIAFAVAVEWGGGGGATAGAVAKELLQACVDLGYLEGQAKGAAPTARVE